MRQSNNVFTTSEYVTTTRTAASEYIVVCYENKDNKYVSVVVNYLDENNIVIGEKRFDITGDHYDLLMSESPDFAPGKPLNEYREVDLFYIIDLIDT